MRRLLFAAIALGAVSLMAPPARAIDQGTIGPIGPEHPTITKKFGALAGQYADPAVNAFAEFRPPACRAVTYCDAVNLSVAFPKSLERETFFGVTVTLDWDNPRTAKNPTGNDLDMFLWPDDGEAAGGPSSSCSSPNDDDCDNLTSETITITEPDDTKRSGAPLFFTIVNSAGVNAGGYQLTIKWYTFDLPPPPDFKRPEVGVSTQKSVSGPIGVTPAKEAPSNVDSGPSPTPRKILVPGPDGKLHELELPAYAAGAKFSAEDTKAPSPWVPAFVAGGLVLVGLSAYLVIRARRQDADLV
jgi:hypothetical protein